MGKRLEPCPFCGSDDLAFSQPCTDGGWGVLCRECHTNQDTRTATKEAAAEAWNTRSRPMPDVETVARIVDPLASWDGVGWKHGFDSHEEAVADAKAKQSMALTKATAILSLFQQDTEREG